MRLGRFYLKPWFLLIIEHFLWECSLFFFENQEGVSLSQEAVEIPLYTITYKIRGTFDDMYFVFDSASTPVGGSQTYEVLFGGDPGGTEIQDSWYANTGYSVNSVSVAAGRAYVQPGQRVWIRKLSDISGGWNGSTTQSFILEANDQTVNVT